MLDRAWPVKVASASVWATKKLKARITFPRAGYVEWKPSDARPETHGCGRRHRDRLGGGCADQQEPHGRPRAEWQRRVLGVILSLAFVVASFTQRAPHLLVLAPVALLLGLAFSVSAPGWDAMNWMFIALGGATALRGAVRLWMFLRSHPPEQRV